MNITCSDNRFEVIKKAKESIIESTNIETSKDEMKVLDSFLFRCWQMGWLNKYDKRDIRELKRHDPVMVSDNGALWSLALYCESNQTYDRFGNEPLTGWNYIVPLDDFDFNNLVSNIDKNII